MMLLAGTCHHSPVPRESFSVFSMLATLPPLKSAEDSCYVTSSILGFKVGERIPKHDYKAAVDQAQECT